MNLKVSESSTQLLIAQTVILRLGYLRLKPELGFTIGGCDMTCIRGSSREKK
jgi:hypothetical protein